MLRGAIMDTLVLSASYEPMVQVGWQQAMGMVVAGRVEVIEAYADRVIRSVTARWEMPAVVRFPCALRWSGSRTRFCRHNLWLREDRRCMYCRTPLTLKESTFDHVLPRSRGGKTSWENVVIACQPCNHRKGNQMPQEAGLTLHRQPVRPHSLPGAKWGGLSWRDDMPAPWRPYLTAYA